MEMNKVTDNLEQKVDILLKSQESEFVESYRLHMSRVSQEVKEMNARLKEYEQKILYYENEGRLAQYVQKVRELECEVSNLYVVVENKDSKIKSLRQEIEMLKKMQQHSDEQIKSMNRRNLELREDDKTKKNKSNKKEQSSEKNYSEDENIEQQQKEERSRSLLKNMSSIETFATEIPSSPVEMIYERGEHMFLTNNSNGNNVIETIEESEIANNNNGYNNNKNKDGSLNKKDNNTSSSPLLLQSRIKSLEKELYQLKRQNNKLLTQSNSYTLQLTEIGEIFWNSIQETKRFLHKNNMHKVSNNNRKVSNNNCNKYNVNDRTTKTIITSPELILSPSENELPPYEQFTKEDKFSLLIRLLEHEDVLNIVYQNMFANYKKSGDNNNNSILSISMMSNNNKNKHNHHRAQSVIERKTHVNTNSKIYNNNNPNHNHNDSIISRDNNNESIFYSNNNKKNNYNNNSNSNKINFLPIIKNKINFYNNE